MDAHGCPWQLPWAPHGRPRDPTGRPRDSMTVTTVGCTVCTPAAPVGVPVATPTQPTRDSSVEERRNIVYILVQPRQYRRLDGVSHRNTYRRDRQMIEIDYSQSVLCRQMREQVGHKSVLFVCGRKVVYIILCSGERPWKLLRHFVALHGTIMRFHGLSCPPCAFMRLPTFER